MDEWRITPRIAFLSPEPASGKTRALEITKILVPEPFMTSDQSPAFIFRRVGDQEKVLPTLLFDEIDTVLGPKVKGDNEQLRGLINAGYSRSGKVGRCVGKDHTPVEFPVYCAVAMAGLGTLPDSVLTRSIVVKMRRRKKDEHVEPFEEDLVVPEADNLRVAIACWAATQKRKFAGVRPKMPEGVEDRHADIWKPLLVIADAVGGRWPDLARGTAGTLVTQSERVGGESIGLRLLSDLRTIFGDDKALHTSTIIERLCRLEESPWNSLRGYPITDHFLADTVREYGVRSKNVRASGMQKKGYDRASFFDAWEVYLTALPEAVPIVPSVPVESSPIEFDFSVPFPQTARRVYAANDNRKPSFDEWRDMSRAEQDALHARLRKKSSF